MKIELLRKYKLLAFPFVFVVIFACTEENKQSVTSTENPFLTETKYSPLESETDEVLKDYNPAQTNEIDLVRNSEDNYTVEYGYSFGECIGFCKSEIEFSSKGVLKTRLRWSDNKEIIEYFSIEDSIYNTLIGSIDYQEFIDFDENLGCGDCADGGLEWIEIKKKEQSKNLSGTYGFKVDCIQPY